MACNLDIVLLQAVTLLDVLSAPNAVIAETDVKVLPKKDLGFLPLYSKSRDLCKSGNFAFVFLVVNVLNFMKIRNEDKNAHLQYTLKKAV